MRNPTRGPAAARKAESDKIRITPGSIDAARGKTITDKVVGDILMIAPETDGTRFVINGAPQDFMIGLDHANYAALVSTLLAANAQGHPVAVKYMGIATVSGSTKSVVAIAKGVHAVISGGSF